jgi:uncharacterized membrane protein YbhN (UPF0104 family)
MLLLAIASGFTVLVHGEAVTWILASGVVLGAGFVAVGPVVRGANRLGSSTTAARLLGRRLSDMSRRLCDTGLLEPALARRLTLLSVARFSIQALMAAEVCAAIGVHIPTWHLAASIPLVILACVLVVTPGGIGIGELSYAGVLHVFGTPVDVAVQWAVAARILISGSCFMVAAVAVTACAAIGRIQSGTQTSHETAYDAEALQGLRSE